MEITDKNIIRKQSKQGQEGYYERVESNSLLTCVEFCFHEADTDGWKGAESGKIFRTTDCTASEW